VPVFTYRWSADPGPITIDDYRRLARKALPEMVWSYVDSGAEDLNTLEANRSAFSRYSLKMKVLTGNGAANLSTTVSGLDLSLPVLLAPTGVVGLSHWTGERGAALAAERQGTLSILSTASSYSLEEVADATERSHVFQLYPRSDPEPQSRQELNAVLLERARRAGYEVLVVTVDVPVRGNREGERRLGMGSPPVMTPRGALDAIRRPRWTRDVLRHRRISLRNLVESTGARAAVRSIDTQFRMMRAEVDWSDLAWIRDHWDGPLLVKGVLDACDAERAVDLGATGVIVSNHGGRQLDGAVAALDALPAIAQRVGDRADVLVDGGVRRGSDIVKALCLGADAVCIGRPYLYGMAVGGPAGAEHVISILREEMTRTMTLMGVAGLGDLGPSWVLPAGPMLSQLETT
jgi:isopentenyl diphosphate isomerase/L-lactate dehydrogenase-like FMN-dependent dehydrogenase